MSYTTYIQSSLSYPFVLMPIFPQNFFLQLIDMSTHTMPPLSLMCEDFLKSMVKSISIASNDVSTSQDALTTRLMNGDTNGFGSHSDDDDEDNENNADDRDPDGDIKMTNGTSSTPSKSSTKSAMKIRKDLMRKNEELKRLQKSAGLNNDHQPANDDDEETRLRFIAKQAVNVEF